MVADQQPGWEQSPPPMQQEVRQLWEALERMESGEAREKAVQAWPRAIYQAATRREALVAFRQWKARWQRLYPKAVACLDKDLDALLACMDCPPALRPKIRTTNAIERCFREVRRRTRPMSAFTNDASCERIVYALIAHMNAQWSRKPLPGFTHYS